MTSDRHPHLPGAGLPALLAATVLPLFPATGQVPSIPRAAPVAVPAPASVETPADAGPGADIPATEADRAASLAALVRDDNPYALILEPVGNGSDVLVLVPGARESGLVAARWQNAILRPYTRADFRALHLKWREFRARGLEVAAKHLALIDPVIDRDARGTVEMVRFISESPLTATRLITPLFREKMRDVLGLPFYAVAPSRSVVIAFASTGRYPRDLGSLASDLFKDSIYPASLEVFEIGNDGVRAIGTLKED